MRHDRASRRAGWRKLCGLISEGEQLQTRPGEGLQQAAPKFYYAKWHGQSVVIIPSVTVTFRMLQPSTLISLGAEPVCQRFVACNFVSNRYRCCLGIFWLSAIAASV